MTEKEIIMEKARELFDVAGCTRLADGDTLLILGLESTPERNLDEFGYLAGKFILYGFRRYCAPGLESIVDLIKGMGFSAEPVGRYGYPLEGEINLKKEAIRAGIGQRGKNTVVLHPVYGNRLRFMGIRTSALLAELAINPPFAEKENPVCRDCSVCIDVCPVKVLEPYRLTDPSLCLSYITSKTEDGRSVLCDKCLTMCPAGQR